MWLPTIALIALMVRAIVTFSCYCYVRSYLVMMLHLFLFVLEAIALHSRA